MLLDRFKGSIRNAVKQRMAMLGIDTRKKSLSLTKLRQLSDTIHSNRSIEFIEMRRHFQSQLEQQQSRKSKSSKMRIPVAMETTPPRAPVPTPRLRNDPKSSIVDQQVNSFIKIRNSILNFFIFFKKKENQNSLLMARDGEFVNEPINQSTKGEDDSFSLSSLDAILNELKKPNPTKTVQWRSPVELTNEKPIETKDNSSWDS